MEVDRILDESHSVDKDNGEVRIFKYEIRVRIQTDIVCICESIRLICYKEGFVLVSDCTGLLCIASMGKVILARCLFVVVFLVTESYLITFNSNSTLPKHWF